MDNPQFIRVKSLEGELIISQKKKQLGCTLTTKEVVFQQPHATYHIRLEDVIGMIPFQLKNPRSPIGVIGETQLVTHFPKNYYKLSARKVVLIKRHGVHEQHNTKLIIPLNSRFIDRLTRYAGLTVLPTT